MQQLLAPIGGDTPVPTQPLRVPGMPTFGGPPDTAGTLSIPPMPTASYAPKMAPKSNEFVHAWYTMISTGADHEKTFLPGQILFKMRSLNPAERGLSRIINLQTLAHWLEMGTVPGEKVRRPWDIITIFKHWNFIGIWHAEGAGGQLKTGQQGGGRICTVVAQGFTDRLQNAFGDNIRPGTRCFVIFKKVKLAREQAEVIAPNGTMVKRRRIEELSVWQPIPYADFRYSVPPMVERSYIEDDPTDPEVGCEKFGPWISICTAGTDIPDYTNPIFLKMAHRNTTVNLRMMEAYMRR